MNDGVSVTRQSTSRYGNIHNGSIHEPLRIPRLILNGLDHKSLWIPRGIHNGSTHEPLQIPALSVTAGANIRYGYFAYI